MKIKKTFNYKIDSDEAIEIGESFGIDEGFINNVIDIELPDILPRLVYITGESGCGKTTLLNSLGNETKIFIDENKPLYTYGDTLEKTLQILSLVGLGDATMFLTPYKYLSDSQKMRARLSKMILESKNDCPIIIDEFLSSLDRDTAFVIAYNFQKIVRKLNLTAIIASAHVDIIPYLQPDLIIAGKAFPSRWDVAYPQYKEHNKNLFINNNDLKIIEETKDWYKKEPIGVLHYKGKYTGGIKDYIRLQFKDKTVGFLIGTYRMHDGGRRISRLVVHPSYRGIGFGKLLVQYYLKKYPNADVVAAMAKYNPIFERAGMRFDGEIETKANKSLLNKLTVLGFEPHKWFSKSYCTSFCMNNIAREILSEFTKEAHYLIAPGGKRLSDTEIKNKILGDERTAGRILWRMRPKKLFKYMGVYNE